MTSLLRTGAYRLAFLFSGSPTTFLIALAVKEVEALLPGGEQGVALSYCANNPVRFEQRLVGRVLSDDGAGTVEVALTGGGEGTTAKFEPLTLERWKQMSIVDQDELLAVIPDTETLIAYYWNDWVSDDW